MASSEDSAIQFLSHISPVLLVGLRGWAKSLVIISRPGRETSFYCLYEPHLPKVLPSPLPLPPFILCHFLLLPFSLPTADPVGVLWLGRALTERS